jgi:hypothetical protein
MTNSWCNTLGIDVPDLESVKGHSDANTYSLFLVALLERGEAMTLEEVATRFEHAGVADAERALLSLKRCRPGRAPAYRDGDHYYLDPHDDELGLWAFRLGLRPPRVPRLRIVRSGAGPLPGNEVALTVAELDEAWNDAILNNWSKQRVVLAVLDANGGPMPPEEVVAFVEERTRGHGMHASFEHFDNRGSAVEVSPDGHWSISPDAGEAVKSARGAVRDRITMGRRYADLRSTPAEMEATRKVVERRRAAHAAELAKMSRVLLYAYPAKEPEAVALLDVTGRRLETFVADEIERLPERLATFDILGAMNVRALLRALHFDPGERRLAELGPPQKTMTVNQRGKTLKITTELLIRSSCGIDRPFAEGKKIRTYLREGHDTRLRRRLEADVKSLYALYQHGRLHGTVRVRWGFLDERLSAPWVHQDEETLYHLRCRALERGELLEVVVGSAPGWSDPWARAQPVVVQRDENGWSILLIDERGYVIDTNEVQLARLRGVPD